MNLMVELDGTLTPLSDCDWVRYAPCGCPVACVVASYAPTEDLAWKEFHPNNRDRDHAKRQGHRMELMTHQRWSAEIMPLMLTRCPHQQATP